MLPDWVPWWALLGVAVPVLLYLLVFLLMPFSVVGVKGRLDVIDARLDELHNEIRILSLRLPDSNGSHPVPGGFRPPVPPSAEPESRQTAQSYERAAYRGQSRKEDARAPDENEAPSRRSPAARPGRAEPRLNWPR